VICLIKNNNIFCNKSNFILVKLNASQAVILPSSFREFSNATDMKFIHILIILFTAINVSTFAQSASLQFETNLKCEENEYCATIQIKSNSLVEFELGVSSIFFEYNEEALSFKTYESLNFDGSTQCEVDTSTFSLFGSHQYDEKIGGKFNTTITYMDLGQVEVDCNKVYDEFMDVAEICFDIMDNNESADLRFVSEHTNFNQGMNTDLLEEVVLVDKTESLSCTVSSIEDVELNAFEMTVQQTGNGLANVSFVSEDYQIFKFQLTDANGKIIKTEKIDVVPGVNRLSIDTSNQPNGIYLFSLMNNQFYNTARIANL